MLYYCPLESYRERYTYQLSAPKTGWLEKNWIEAGINYTRVDGPPAINNVVRTGVALDPAARCCQAFSQVIKLVQHAMDGQITSNDVIYFDDFWHPGIESLPYTFDLLGIKPRMYAYCHAQSVDEFDFTAKMRAWIRPFEMGIGSILEGIFVACPMLKRKVIEGGLGLPHKVHDVGHPFDSEEVMSRMPNWLQIKAFNVKPRQNKVIYSSRWDEEKSPLFFLQVADRVRQLSTMPVQFVVCSGAPQIRSNNPMLLRELKRYVKAGAVTLRQDLSKEEYYSELATAKVQINTAKQDWISYALLEASVAGAWPLCPNHRAFPEVLRFDPKFLYRYEDVEDAAQSILQIIQRDDLWTEKALEERAWIHTRYDTSWRRMALVMGLVEHRAGDLHPFRSVYEGHYGAGQQNWIS